MITEKLRPELLVLFIGFNPSLRSYERGFNYAGRANRFYKVLYLSGLTERLYAPEESDQLLDDYRYGFTNIVTRPTARADEITKNEYREGAMILYQKISLYRPRIACFVGKGVYLSYKGTSKQQPWGFTETPTIQNTRDFVAPSTSGLVRMTLAEQVAIYSQLAIAIQPCKGAT